MANKVSIIGIASTRSGTINDVKVTFLNPSNAITEIINPKNIDFQNYYVLGQVSTPFSGALKFEFCISENVNKTVILLSKMRDLQGFRRKKKTLQDFSCKVNFSIVVLQSGFAPNQKLRINYISAIAA